MSEQIDSATLGRVVPGLEFMVCDSGDPLDAERVTVKEVREGQALLASRIGDLNGWHPVAFVAGALEAAELQVQA